MLVVDQLHKIKKECANFNDFTTRKASGKLLRDKAFNAAKNPKFDEYQHGLASMIYKCFNKKSPSLADKSTSGTRIKNEIISNKELTEKLHKPIIKKLKKKKKSPLSLLGVLILLICN